MIPLFKRGVAIVTQPPTIPHLVFPSAASGTITPSMPLLTTTSSPPVVARTPEPSILNGKIVFTCQPAKDSRYNQICIMAADGSNYRRLTSDDNYDHFYPSLSPDGLQVVYSSNQTGGYEIYLLDWFGNQVQLTQEGQVDPAGAFAPEISPDGQSIVYTRISSELEKSIWIMDLFSGQAHWLFGSVDSGAWDPTWSPDGTRILFMSDRTGSNQLHTINIDGSNIQQITDLEDLRGRNDWSPDGKTIATYIGPSWSREIIFMDVDGTNLRYLTDGGNNLAPSFSPDGQWVTITSYKDLYQDNNGCEIYILRIDGSDMRRLTDNDYCDWQPRWGP